MVGVQAYIDNMEIIMEVHQKIWESHSTSRPNYTTLGIYLREALSYHETLAQPC